MICPNCHSENRAHAKYCDECGFPLHGRIAAAAAAADGLSEAMPMQEGAGGQVRASHDERATALPEPDCPSKVDQPQQDDAADADPCESALSASGDEVIPAADVTARFEEVEDDSAPENRRADALVELPAIFTPREQAEDDSDQIKPTVPAHDSTDDAEDASDNCVSADGSHPVESASSKPASSSPADSAACADECAEDEPDLSGLEHSAFGLDGYERLVEPGYTPPKPAFRDGKTEQMPRIEDEAAPAATEFLESSAKEKRKGVRAGIIALIAVLIAGIIAAGVTYKLEMWGGRSVPDVVGMTAADASQVLSERGFTVRIEHVTSDETEGLVLLEDPASSSREPRGSEVVIHVAQARVVPEVVGLQRAEALAMLEAEGFDDVTVESQKSDDDEDKVLSVSPASGERAKSSAAIVLTVTEPYRVPSVESLTLDQAKEALVQAGYTPQVAYAYTESVPDGTVLGTDPAPDEKLASGSSVTLQVARSRAAELTELSRQVVYLSLIHI